MDGWRGCKSCFKDWLQQSKKQSKDAKLNESVDKFS